MRKIVFILVCLLVSTYCSAQFESKLNALVFIGMPRYTPEDSGPSFQNVFNGYKPYPYLGFGLDYAFNNKLSAGVNIKLIRPLKDNHKILNSNLGLGLKYNFVPSDKTLSPFVHAEFNFSSILIDVEGYEESFDEVEGYQEDASQPTYLGSNSEVSNSTTTLSPVLGYMVGLGTDITLKQKYSLWVSLNYFATDAHNHAKLVETHPENTSKFSFIVLKVGIKLGFLRSKSLI